MEYIKVNKQELLTIVKENREKHKSEYLESIKAYRVKCGDILSQELQKIVNGENFNLRFGLEKPESHEKEYDLTIKMLEMSVDEVIEISQNEFNQLINDNWEWKYSFSRSVLSNQSYVGLRSISGTTGNYDISFAEDEI